MTKKVFVSRPIVPDAIDKLKSFFQVEVWNETTPPPKSVLIEQMKEFRESEEYKPVAAIRQGASTSESFVVEGFDQN